MNSSNFNEVSSGFPANFSFNAPPASVPPSGSVFAKARVSKRRTINRFNVKTDDNDKVVPGVNPFLPQSGIASGGSGIGEFGFRVDKIGLDGKRNSLREGLIDEMKNLNIGIGSKESVGLGGSGLESNHSDNVSSSFKELSASKHLEDLNGKSDSSGYNESAKEDSVGNTGSSVLRNLESDLPRELKKKLNIIGPKEVHGNNVVGNGECIGEFVGGSVEKGVGSDASKERMEAELADCMKTLNMKDHAKVTGTATTSESHDKPGVIFGDSGKVEVESVLLTEMEKKLNIENKVGDSSGKPVPKEFSFAAKIDANFSTNSQVPLNVNKDYTSVSEAIASTSYVFSSSGKSFRTVGGVSSDGPRKNDGFTFTTRLDDLGASSAELRTPLSKVNEVSGFGKKTEFNAKKERHNNLRHRKKKGTFRQTTNIQPQLAQNFVSVQSIPPEVPEVSESYSPMDVSPYQVALPDDRSSRETSVTSNESFVTNAFSQPTALNDTTEEELVAAAEQMDINGGEESAELREKASGDAFAKGFQSEGPTGLSASGSQTESFKTAADGFDFVEDNSVTSAPKSESFHSLAIESENSGESVQSGFPLHGEDTGGSNFTFSATSASQKQFAADKRSNKKKSWTKAGQGSRSFKSVTENPYASSSLQFSVTSSPLLSQLERGDQSTPHYKDGKPVQVNKEQDMQPQCSPTSPISPVQEACEKWRLRGNQAYKSGDMSKAEDFYTHGISCVSENDMTRSSLRALMLCYSNRAATRMSLGRIRDALADCMMASEIDPNFFKVHLRAANCYLVLGEIDEASRYYKNCLQSGSEVCVDRKVAVEASEGIQKAQKVSDCMKRSADLLLAQTPDNIENALEIIAEALMISSYSENLLKMKAEALFMLQRYEEVVLLCEQTLDSAEKNFSLTNANSELAEQNHCDAKGLHCRIWRSSLLLKSYFQLGKLEEGLACLEKQEHLISVKYRNGKSLLSSSIPLLWTVRELTRLKAAGNEAFQAGRYTEAIEQYTAALSCSVESRPFAAVCFCNRAAAYKALGQITDAIADCNLAIALDGNYLKAISRRATLYEMIRDYDQAAADLQRVVSILTKQVEEKTIKMGAYDRSLSCVNDLRQAQLRLSEYEAAARKEIPLDMYLILGVEPSVSASDIKKAYRKAALRHHPDKASQFLAKGDNGDENLWKQIAVEVHKNTDRLFKMIGEAYAVLSDPGKRSRYDLEEELRNTQKKHNGASTSRTQTDDMKHPFDRGASRQQWRDVPRSYGYSQPRSAEATRWTRYT